MFYLKLIALGLEVVGGLIAFQPMITYYYTKEFTMEYLNSLELLKEDMLQDGLLEDEEFDEERMINSMGMVLYDAKVKATMGLIGFVVMVFMLIKTLCI